MGTLQNEIIKWKDSRPNLKPIKKNKNRSLSEREIKELMGVYGPRYSRRRGAIRQK
ncbi:hypothetical protein J5Y03_10155 [Bacillus sp. RG28]|uniref:Phage protein n=1 Tax=Gottfriedia endophytica TaxID=2820819 RepID=A0A940NPV6_9BACI|nr:hypothetical protein [Gottfriedia endophytica]MBP0725550.1 hypothetical protein [Gottfriedia endophytica]